MVGAAGAHVRHPDGALSVAEALFPAVPAIVQQRMRPGKEYRADLRGVRGVDARAENTAGAARVERRRGRAAGGRRLVSRLRRVAAAYLVVVAVGSVAIGSTACECPTGLGGRCSLAHGGLGPKAPWTGKASPGAAWGQPSPPRAEVHDAVAVQARIDLSQVTFDGRAAWPDGPEAIRGYLEEALNRMGITEPSA
jgi:hypothetical protein